MAADCRSSTTDELQAAHTLSPQKISSAVTDELQTSNRNELTAATPRKQQDPFLSSSAAPKNKKKITAEGNSKRQESDSNKNGDMCGFAESEESTVKSVRTINFRKSTAKCAEPINQKDVELQAKSKLRSGGEASKSTDEVHAPSPRRGRSGGLFSAEQSKRNQSTEERSLKRGEAHRKGRSGVVDSEETGSSAEASDEESNNDEVQERRKDGASQGEEIDSAMSPSGKKRKKIRKLLKRKGLRAETKEAEKAEKERVQRVQQQSGTVLVETKPSGKEGVPDTVLRLGFECDAVTGEPAFEVHPRIVRQLKPHQVDAVCFLWECLVENSSRFRTEPGSGCILAHCMGLGKSLSTITLLHTLLKSPELAVKHVLLICPVNTIYNWRDECAKWLPHKDRFPVFDVASCCNNKERRVELTQWQKQGGVLLIGYSMFRILATGSNTRHHVYRRLFTSALVDPGPDLVVCDEGHLLKNSASAISRAVNSIRTRRRLVLTGTPLQNNLIEYHCMVSFVKQHLLGTAHEFNNRFVNPINNGQSRDASPADIRLMKNRSHVLNRLLKGCVQRRDYTVLTQFLPPKHEYALLMSLSDKQADLYTRYLQHVGRAEQRAAEAKVVASSLFQDYNQLMLIWTHPWLLYKSEERAIKRALDYNSDESMMTTDDEERSEKRRRVGAKSKNGSNGSMTGTCEVVLSSASEDIDTACGADGSKGSDTDTTEPNPRKKGKRRKEAARKQGEKMERGLSGESWMSTDSEVEVFKRMRARSTRETGDDLRHAIHGEVVRGWKSQTRSGKDFEFTDLSSQVREEPWFKEHVPESMELSTEVSPKLQLLGQLLRLCAVDGQKLLVFSQSLFSLDLIERFLSHWSAQGEAEPLLRLTDGKLGPWEKRVDYFRLDGSTSALARQQDIQSFRNKKCKRARLFLISTRAGSLGVNLEVANRVVIFDASWNPSHDVQSLFRVYRFGQTRPVYIYRLLAASTMEERIYERQVAKLSLSHRVVDEKQIDRCFSESEMRELYKFVHRKPDQGELLRLPQDKLLAELLLGQRGLICGYHEHDSLLEARPEEDLTEEERRAAWEEYERELRDPNWRLHERLRLMQEQRLQEARLMQQRQALQQRARSAAAPSQFPVQIDSAKYKEIKSGLPAMLYRIVANSSDTSLPEIYQQLQGYISSKLTSMQGAAANAPRSPLRSQHNTGASSQSSPRIDEVSSDEVDDSEVEGSQSSIASDDVQLMDVYLPEQRTKEFCSEYSEYSGDDSENPIELDSD